MDQFCRIRFFLSGFMVLVHILLLSIIVSNVLHDVTSFYVIIQCNGDYINHHMALPRFHQLCFFYPFSIFPYLNLISKFFTFSADKVCTESGKCILQVGS